MIPGSLVYSPPFVRSLLSMAKLGAGPTEGGGGTGPEISTALGIPLPNEELEGFSQNLEDVLSYFKVNPTCPFLWNLFSKELYSSSSLF